MLYKLSLVLILTTYFLHVEAGCNMSIYAPSSLLESPYYPDMYDVGNCYYFIKVPSEKSLVLFWLSFDVGEPKINHQCHGDSMTVYDGIMFSPFRQWTFCGSDDMLNITSTSNMMTLWLKSNTSHQFDGFQVQYDSLNTPCSTQSLGSNFGTFYSPNFPQTFPVPSCITYKVQVPLHRVIQLTWNQFDIGSNALLSSCMNYLQLYDQSIRSENEIFKACSKHKLPKQFTSSGNVVYVQFVASVMSPFSKGFEVSYVSITSQQLRRKILFSNASCEDIEWYYDAPFGNIAIEKTSSCAAPATVMAAWLLAVIISGASLLSAILIIAAGCLLARCLAQRRHRYQQL